MRQPGTPARRAPALDAMVRALGGQAWLSMKTRCARGMWLHFSKASPAGGTTEYWEYHACRNQDRLEYTKHRDVLQFYVGREGWEVTYRGKKALPQDQVDDYLRRRDHSIEDGRQGVAQRS